MFSDFTYSKYRELLKAIVKKDYKIYKVCDWIKYNPETGILLRHDVDRYPKNSLRTSQIETELGIQSTYYFRSCSCSYNPDIIKEISKGGHEIGYHYEDLSIAKGDDDKAIILFQENLNRLRNIVKVETISMHGRPMSKFDNRDIWKKFDFRQFEIKGEAYLTINYNNTYYFSDTGRTWSSDGINIRDKVKTNVNASISNTESLIKFINNNKSSKIAILTHPERWNDDNYLWLKYYLRDAISNNAKRFVNFARNKKGESK